MRIILTHEQADFDAIASMLGAWLLDESALPVLPRRMNRNAQAFVRLNAAELPFIEARDLPSEPIASVMLVDTQSLVSLRGLGDRTPVHVVDHHPERPGHPPHWSLECVNLGAATTLLVESLREHDSAISSLHATLLLIGIYEDTGSLTYTRTTARDLQAAAFLLEQGADLTTVLEFIHHPLSGAQQKLYDHLRANAEHHTIHGHSLLIASGDAQDMDEELSTLAHKLRDFYEPDGLFLLILTRSGLQMIARSTCDAINVAEVAAHFGGGGHDRAAAAIIRGRELDAVRAELMQHLTRWVQPAITVAQIMSKRPQILQPDTPLQEIFTRMQRFGYEGYPVAQNGKVIGLVTRRSVDRAAAHNLKLTASNLMDAGEVTIAPHDSIEHLQRAMTESGWGQIPVVDPASGAIVGIVTRTDLLKILTRPRGAPAHPNLADRLKAALPPDRLKILEWIAEMAHARRLPVYIVGGFVRDLLLERPSLDFDIVVEGVGSASACVAGDAIALARALAARHGGRVTSHNRFGTAKWVLETPLHTAIDLITARAEFYTHPTALPTVEHGSIKLDLHRRDFTINTLALRLDGRHFGELHDPWGGWADLRRGLVRVLHSVSFVDDPTRMLRAVRFEQRFGFQIETRTLQLLHEALPLLARVSGDRIRHELDHSFGEPNRQAIFSRFQALGLLHAIHEDLVWDDWLCARLDSLPDPFPLGPWGLSLEFRRYPLRRIISYALWVIRLPRPRAQAVLQRLSLPHEIAESLLAASDARQTAASLTGLPPSEVVSRLEAYPLLAVYAAFLASDTPETAAQLESFATRWRSILPLANGNDLRALGLKPGPAFREILTRLRRAWLDGEISTPEGEKTLLARLISAL